MKQRALACCYAENAGVRIHYSVVGDGFPLVLQTGAGGDGTMWKDASYVGGLAGFRCILIDHRGHGKSDRPHGVDNHSVECYVEDVMAVLDAVGVERAVFWGYSAGAGIGFALAATHPERVTALIVSGAVFAVDYCDPDLRQEATVSADILRQHGVGHLLKPLEAVEGITFPAWFWRQMKDTDPEMFALEVLGAAEWRGPWSVLPQITSPVLLLVGELEDPDGDAERVASRLPKCTHVIFKSLGHVGAYLRRDLALAHALPFLREVTGRAKGPQRDAPHEGHALD